MNSMTMGPIRTPSISQPQPQSGHTRVVLAPRHHILPPHSPSRPRRRAHRPVFRKIHIATKKTKKRPN